MTGHFGHKTLRHQDTLGHFGTDLKTLRYQKHGTRHSTRVPWSRIESRDTSTQDNSDETQLHRWFGSNFGTNFVVPKWLGAEMSCGRSVRLPFFVCDGSKH